MSPCPGGRAAFALLFASLLMFTNISTVVSAFHIVEITEPGDARNDRSPRLAVAGDVLMAVWIAFDGSNPDIMYRVRSQGSWSAAGKLVASTDNERDVALCSSGGLFYAAWATDSSQYATGPDWDIAISVYDPVAGWSAPVELSASNDTANDYAPFLLPYQNGVVVAWHSIIGDEGNILLATFDGSSSGTTVVTEGWKGMNQNPAGAFLDGTLWMAWSSSDNAHTDGADLDIVAAPFNLQGGTLGDAVQLSDPADTEDDMFSSILSLGGRLYVAWQSKDKTLGPGDDEDLGLAIYDGAWNTHALTSPHDSGDDIYPHLFEFRGTVWLAWQCSDPSITGDNDWDIVAAKLEGTALGTPQAVSEEKESLDDGGSFVRGHDALQTGDDILIAWETANSQITDGADRDIVMATLPQPGQEKAEDEGGTSSGTMVILVIIFSVCGLAAILVAKRRKMTTDTIDKEKPKRKRQTRN